MQLYLLITPMSTVHGRLKELASQQKSSFWTLFFIWIYVTFYPTGTRVENGTHYPMIVVKGAAFRMTFQNQYSVSSRFNTIRSLFAQRLLVPIMCQLLFTTYFIYSHRTMYTSYHTEQYCENAHVWQQFNLV